MRHLTTYNLFEMNANPYKWEWAKPSGGISRTAMFYSEDDRYFVNFIADKDDHAYTVTFESDKFGTNTQGFGNTGNAMRILSTVFDVMVSFLDEDPQREVTFIGAKDKDDQVEPSKRDRIYKVMMSDLPDNYEWSLGSDKKTIRIKRASVYEGFSFQKLNAKFKDGLRKLGSAVTRERKETVKAARIFMKIIARRVPSPEEIKFLKSQSLDIVKILSLIGLQAVPGSSVAIAALEAAGKKYGISLLPKDQSQLVAESERQVVTFDFDGVMHTGVYPGTIHPYPDPGMWTPNEVMIDKLKEESESNDIYIVSARDCEFGGGPNRWIKRFVEEHKLPVKGIVCTNNEKKGPYLEDLKSIRHYDDNPSMKYELRDSGIEFVYIDSSAYESLMNEHTGQAGKGSMLLMRGEDLGDGTARLYAIPIERVLSVTRMKADNTKAQDANMVLLGDDFYRLTIDGGKLKPMKVGFTNKVNMLKALGMTERNLSGERLKVVLNSKTGKTPLHWETLKYDYIGKMIAEMGSRIMDLPGIRWTN